jgi:integrase
MSVRKRTWRSQGEVRSAWLVDYRDQHGERHAKTFDRKKDADDFHATVAVAVRAGIHTADRRSITIAEAGRQWLAAARDGGLERTTVEQYEQHLRIHLVPFIGAVRLSQLTLPAVKAFEDKLRAAGRSPAMIRKIMRSLSAILTEAQGRGLVAQNVVKGMRAGRRGRDRDVRVERRQRGKLKVGVDIPSPAEIRVLIPELKGRRRGQLLLTAIFTGLRSSELRGLRWSDVDLKRAVIHVRQRADTYNTIGALKSEAGERTVPLPPIVVSTLREWKLACPKSELDLTFPNTTGGADRRSEIVEAAFQPAQVRAGIINSKGKAKYTGLHSLRHFYASWCINRKEDGGLGLPLKVVQHRLGHSGIQITANRYGHLFPSEDSGAELAAAEKAFFG